MITAKKLRIYEKFNGDIDGFARGSTLDERDTIEDGDWFLIDKLLQALTIIQSGYATTEFAAEAHQRLAAVVRNEDAREILRELSTPQKA